MPISTGRPARRRTLAAVAAVGAVLALVSCGDDSTSTTGNNGDSSGYESPIADLLGFENQSPAEARKQQLAIEEAVAACMRAEGWEYQPVDYSAQFPEGDADVDFSDPVAFGEKHGYGIVYGYEQFTLPYLEDGEGGGPGGPVFEDPNADFVASLTESERDDYYASLHGQQVFGEASALEDDGATDVTIGMPTLEEQGCYGQAQLEVVGEQPYTNPDVQERLNDYYTGIEDDPRLDDARAQWAECMNDVIADLEPIEGTDITRPEDMYNYMTAVMALAMDKQILPLDPDTGMPIGDFDDTKGWSSTQNADGTGLAFVGDDVVLSEDVIERLRTQELDLWKDDRECQDDAELDEIRVQIEQEFVDQVLAEFPELSE
jgi:hypothetical protein